MNINIEPPTQLNLDFIKLQKMSFIYNAIESGWNVKKIDDKYIFSKKHEGKREVYLDSYLNKFIQSNIT
jgi:hypothetical protein